MRDERGSDREMREERAVRRMMRRWIAAAVGGAVLTIAAIMPAAASAQGAGQRVSAVPRSPLGARVVPDSTSLLAFADTAGVRIELAVANGRALGGQMLTAAIVPVEGGRAFWQGKIGPVHVDSNGVARLVHQLRGLKPERWSSEHPRLYRLAVFLAPQRELSVRFGFRSLT